MEVLEKQRTIKNIGYLTISKILVYLLSIVTITLIPRYLGVEGYGQLNFVLSFIGIFAIFGDLGINTLIFRDVSRNTKLKDKYFNNLFLSNLFLLFLVSLIMILVGFFLDKPLVVKQMIYLGFFFMLFSNLIVFINTYLSSLQLFKYQAYYEFLSKLLYTIFVLLAIYLNKGVIGVFLSQIIAFLIVFVYLFFIIRKYIKFNLKLNLPFFTNKLKYSWPFALGIIFYVIFFSFDRLFISFLKGDYHLGLYSIGVTFVIFLMTIISIFSNIYFNLFSKYAFKKQVVSFFNIFLKISIIISLPIFFGGIFLSKEIISLVFGINYIPGYLSFIILLFFFFISSITILFANYLYAHKHEKYVIKIRGVATGINILLNVIFIPFLGIVGAAITTIISELIILIYFYLKIKTKIDFVFFNLLYKIVFSCLIMLFFIYLFKYIYPIIIFNNSFDVLVIIAIGGIVYLISLFLFNLISIKEIKNIISYFHK